MALIKKSMAGQLLEQGCEQCNKGVYRVGLEVLKTNPQQWEHFCNHCQHRAFFTMVFPVLEYRDKWFMLGDHLRFVPQEPHKLYVGRE